MEAPLFQHSIGHFYEKFIEGLAREQVVAEAFGYVIFKILSQIWCFALAP
jgi:hypothetical protein